MPISIRSLALLVLCCPLFFQTRVPASEPSERRAQECFQSQVRIKTSAWLKGIYFSPDGRLVTQRGRKRLKVWMASDGTLYKEYTGNDDRISALAFSRDGSRIAAGDRGSKAWVWDVHTGQLIAQLKTKHYDEVKHIALSPDGRWLVTMGAGGSLLSIKGNTKAKLWEVETGQLKAALSLPALDDVLSSALAFSPDGKTLAVALDRQAGLWDVMTGELRAQLIAPEEMSKKFYSHGSNALREMLFSPDGQLIATLSFYGGYVRLWNAADGKLKADLGPDGRALAFSPDGKLLAVGTFGTPVRLFDLTNMKLSKIFYSDKAEVASVSFTPDGRLLAASGDKDTYIWEMANGQLKQKLARARQAQFSPDGRTLATVYDEHLTLWNVFCR